VKALQSPETKARFANLTAESVLTKPEALGLFMRSELTKYEVVVKRSGAKVD
jgi:tripartite-type tricarboxylate transporter receptor subunit TctC